MIRTRPNKKIATRDRNGAANGFLLPVFNATEGWVAPEQMPAQIYLTVVAPNSAKGPHLHMQRWGLFTCIRGDVKIVVKEGENYTEHFSGENHEFATVQVPPGLPGALVNVGDGDAYVLNAPAPAWEPDNQDDHPVEAWTYPLPPEGG